MSGRVEEFAGEGGGRDARAREQRREAEEGGAEAGDGGSWRGCWGRVELGMAGKPAKRGMTGGRWRGYSGVVAVLDSSGGGARAAAAAQRRRRR